MAGQKRRDPEQEPAADLTLLPNSDAKRSKHPAACTAGGAESESDALTLTSNATVEMPPSASPSPRVLITSKDHVRANRAKAEEAKRRLMEKRKAAVAVRNPSAMCHYGAHPYTMMQLL
jgi:hypothetical protein